MGTEDQVARYLGFARMFKPKVSEESQELLVQQYKHLRQRDSGGSAKSSWRITVRQLESMLRLSEAFARLHCSEEVSSKHVKEAYRLLNKSIIRVDQPDVNLDEQYKKMSFLIIDHIKTKEDEQEVDDGDAKGDTTPTKSDVINWYLNEISGDIESEEELVEHKQIVEKVVDRLIYQDQVIVPLNNPEGKGEEDPFLVIHPNYNVHDL